MKSIKKYSFRNLLSFILALFAIGVMFYPIIANLIVSNQVGGVVSTFNHETSNLSTSKIDQQLASAKAYNTYIYDMSQHIPYLHPKPDYNKVLDVDPTGMMGSVTIPQIGVTNIPVYHGDSESTLSVGIGHIPQTSLPIGGINTHTVLSAHSGRVNDTLFTNLDKLKIGDVFYINTLNLKLKYKISSIKIVLPQDVSTLSVHKGKDEATLVTCYPTGINTHRLLVTGERIPYNQTTPSEKIQRNQYGYNFWVIFGSIILAVLAIIYLIIKVVKWQKTKKED